MAHLRAASSNCDTGVYPSGGICRETGVAESTKPAALRAIIAAPSARRLPDDFGLLFDPAGDSASLGRHRRTPPPDAGTTFLKPALSASHHTRLPGRELHAGGGLSRIEEDRLECRVPAATRRSLIQWRGVSTSSRNRRPTAEAPRQTRPESHRPASRVGTHPEVTGRQRASKHGHIEISRRNRSARRCSGARRWRCPQRRRASPGRIERNRENQARGWQDHRGRGHEAVS